MFASNCLTMANNLTFQSFWDAMGPFYGPAVGARFHDIAPQLTVLLLEHFMEEEEVSIGHGFYRDESWAIVTYDWYDSDKEFSFRLSKTGKYSLYYNFWDDEGLLKEMQYFLTETETNGIPKGLRDLMTQVVQTGASVSAIKKSIQN